MYRQLWRLDYLCIETLSKNIHRYSKTTKEKWELRNCNDLGDRLILACLANSFEEKIFENVYQFILENFYVKKFSIFPKMFEKIKYFDFLNGKSFDTLKIELVDKIELKDVKNKFQLTTNKLIVNIKKRNDFFTNSKHFFTNLYVCKNINIKVLNKNEKYIINMEKLLLKILENTWQTIENVNIFLHHRTKYFNKKIIKILKNRNNIKSFKLNFDKNISIFMSNNFLIEKIETLKSNDKLSYTNFENFYKYFKNFHSIENFEFSVSRSNNFIEKSEKYFSYLKHMDFTKLKILKIHLNNNETLGKEFYNFVKVCPNLEVLKMENGILLPLTNNLKVFELKNFYLDNPIRIKTLNSFIKQSCFTEISLTCVRFLGGCSFGIFKSLEVSHDTLSSLKIDLCSLPDGIINTLPGLIQKFNKLKCFFLRLLVMENKILQDILKSLQFSCQTLEAIEIGERLVNKKFEVCNELLQLLNKCENLIKIDIRISIKEEKIPDLLLILKKFQSTLEVIFLGFCTTEKYFDETLDFLNGCSQLNHVFGLEGPNITFSKTALRKSLYTSRYSLEYVGFFNGERFYEFPRLIMNSSEL